MKRYRTLAFLTAAVLSLGIISGCSGSNESSADGSSTSDDGSSAAADNDELYDFVDITILQASTFDLTMISGMSPYITAYEGLYKFDEDGNVALGLAESVDISDDGLTYTYKIRDDAYYNDGNKVTAYDFEYSWKRLANPDTGAVYGSLVDTVHIKNASDVLYNGADPDTLGVTATDENTLVVEFDSVLPYLEKVLVFPQFSPIKQEVYEQYGDQFGLTVESAEPSAGPFYVSSWDDTHYTYVKNEYYYDADNVYTASVDYQVVTDTTTGIMLWESGNADYVALDKDTEDLYKDDPAYVLNWATTLSYVSVNLREDVLQNANLRKALALSFDKDSIAKSTLGNDAIAADFIIPEKFAYDSNGVSFRDNANQYFLEYNKEQALEYWEKAKEELGIDTLTLELAYTDYSYLPLVAQLLQSDIQTNLPGITIDLRLVPLSTRYSVLGNADYQIFLNTWTGDYDDASTYFDLWTSDNFYNFGGWSNEEYDALIYASNITDATNESARLQDLFAAEEIILDDVPIIPVSQSFGPALLNADFEVTNSIKGFLWQYARKKN